METIQEGYIVLDMDSGKTDGTYHYLNSVPSRSHYIEREWNPVLIKFKDARVAYSFVQDPVYHNSNITKGKKKMRKAVLIFIRFLLENKAATEIIRW